MAEADHQNQDAPNEASGIEDGESDKDDEGRRRQIDATQNVKVIQRNDARAANLPQLLLAASLIPRPASYPRLNVNQERPPPVYKNGWVPSNLERYHRFRTAMLHGEDWNVGLRCFAIYWLHLWMPGRQDPSPVCFPLFENDTEKHAEENLVDHLRYLLNVVEKGKLVRITIMQNASPCWKCADRYLESLGHLRIHHGVQVTIIFSSFYKIKRYTCRNHFHQAEITKDISDRNINGLRRLRDSGFLLKTSEYEDWVHLRIALQLPPNYSMEAYNYSLRKVEDDNLKKDLECLGLL